MEEQGPAAESVAVRKGKKNSRRVSHPVTLSKLSEVYHIGANKEGRFVALYSRPAGVGIMRCMTRHGIVIDQQRLADFCRRHGIRSLRLFGSILGENFGPHSDVDVLVEFAPGRAAGWIGFAGLALELERIIGREVDLRTAADFSERIRRRVLSEAEVQYAA